MSYPIPIPVKREEFNICLHSYVKTFNLHSVIKLVSAIVSEPIIIELFVYKCNNTNYNHSKRKSNDMKFLQHALSCTRTHSQ